MIDGDDDVGDCDEEVYEDGGDDVNDNGQEQYAKD